MSLILALETSAELASVALLRQTSAAQAEACFVREASSVQNHSQTVLPMIQALLAEAGIRLHDCDALAYGAGPGSFTGVRTACGIVQGLAFGADLPVIPVITLLAMAQACRVEHGAQHVLAVQDARMGEVHWAQYRFDDMLGWQQLIAPTLSAPAQVVPQPSNDGPLQACGNAFRIYADAFAQSHFAANALAEIVPHALHIAQLGAQAYQRGETLSAAQAQPLYLRNKVALTTREREQAQRLKVST